MEPTKQKTTRTVAIIGNDYYSQLFLWALINKPKVCNYSVEYVTNQTFPHKIFPKWVSISNDLNKITFGVNHLLLFGSKEKVRRDLQELKGKINPKVEVISFCHGLTRSWVNKTLELNGDYPVRAVFGFNVVSPCNSTICATASDSVFLNSLSQTKWKNPRSLVESRFLVNFMPAIDVLSLIKGYEQSGLSKAKTFHCYLFDLRSSFSSEESAYNCSDEFIAKYLNIKSKLLKYSSSRYNHFSWKTISFTLFKESLDFLLSFYGDDIDKYHLLSQINDIAFYNVSDLYRSSWDQSTLDNVFDSAFCFFERTYR